MTVLLLLLFLIAMQVHGSVIITICISKKLFIGSVVSVFRLELVVMGDVSAV